MTLNEILPDFLKGKKIQRESWRENIWLEARPESNTIRAMILEEDGVRLVTTDERFSLDDLTSNDWRFYE